MRAEVRRGGIAARTSFGWLLLMLCIAGCAESAAPAPAATAQQQCERSGGMWRGTRCETSGSGGGY